MHSAFHLFTLFYVRISGTPGFSCLNVAIMSTNGPPEDTRLGDSPVERNQFVAKWEAPDINFEMEVS